MRLLPLLFLAVATLAHSALPQPDRSVVYKHASDVDLKLQIFQPAGFKADATYPGIVLFFGGGWINGSPDQFYPQCAEFAKRGMVAISADYRTANKNKTSPRECVMDAKSCLRWVRTHAKELGIDPNRLAAGGGSAGGHIALAAVTLPGLNEPGEDSSVPCEAKGLILFNAVIDNGPGGYGYDRVKDYYKDFSPMQNIHQGLPPTLLMFGTKDALVPVKTAQDFKSAMEHNGNRCDLIFYPEQVHGFFNYKDGTNPYYAQTVKASDDFLVSLGLLPPIAKQP